MGRFNLLDEPWISVIVDSKGRSKNISLIELFEQAHNFRCIAGDTRTQDFAVLRILLAIMNTIFTRFDAIGNPYECIELDDRYVQLNEIKYEDELDDYLSELMNTWHMLWDAAKLPKIIVNYLEKWRDKFYLFDDKTPFLQVTINDILPEKISKSKASDFLGKNINRLLSESNNKIALFSPKFEANGNKEVLCEAEIARWLVTLQGYIGLSDKVMFGKEKYKSSKGWLFDIGGIYLEGENLFETLMLNCVLVHPTKPLCRYNGKVQKPCWEYTPEQTIDYALISNQFDNIAQLYTSWSRSVHIDPKLDTSKPFSCSIVKMPDIDHQDQFLEPMSLWRYNDSGDYKGAFTPKKHRINQAMWRSFGLITLSYYSNNSDKNAPRRKPGVITWLNDIKTIIGDKKITIHAISMQDDGNATSWVPVNEIHDSLYLHDLLLVDDSEDGWVIRVNDNVEFTKQIVEVNYKRFVQDICAIRNVKSSTFITDNIEQLYYKIDHYFRDWVTSITPDDSKDKKMLEWKYKLRSITIEHANKHIEMANYRDYKGIVENDKIKNIATIYQSFMYFMNKSIPKKEVVSANKN